jgi:uncharacterized protein
MAEFVIFKDIEFAGKYFVTGFHGIGWTGYIANRYLVGKLGGERIGYMTYEGMRPVVRLWKHRISYPHDIFLIDDHVFLAAEAPMPEETTMDITEQIARWIAEAGFAAAIVIGGLTNAVRRKGDPPLMGVATSKGSHLMDEYGITWMLDDLNIVGPLAGLLFHAERLEVPMLALLPFAESRPDRRAASVAIEKLSEIIGMEINTRELVEAEDLEHQIRQMVTAQLKSEEQESHNYM